MAQRGRVPRFGDWNQNTAYTTYFDTARKGRVSGTDIVNPNDPEQCSELHRPQALAPDHQLHQYPQQRANYGREERGLGGYPQAPPQPGNNSQRANMDQQRRRNHAGINRNPGEVGYRTSASPATPSRAANARQGPAGLQRPTTVPKFGEWDSTDPKSSAGYTAIFDKYKDNRKAGAVNLPTARSQSTPSSAMERPHQNDSFWRSLCPCLNPNSK